jgi:hypothetical protein
MIARKKIILVILRPFELPQQTYFHRLAASNIYRILPFARSSQE